MIKSTGQPYCLTVHWSPVCTYLVSFSKGKHFFAVKILSMDATMSLRGREILELIAMKKLRSRGNLVSLPRLRDDFKLRNLPGQPRICFVMDLLGSSVASLRRMSSNKALPHYMVRIILRQVVQALVHLHSVGIVHTGTL
jgi:serine/threonine-protein kinase SRPK3